MKHFLLLLFFSGQIIISLYGQSSCPLKYQLNPFDFFEETKELRKENQYDQIISLVEQKMEDTPEIWHYYQLACMFALKGDTLRPFEYIYKYIDLQEFARTILSDSDLETLYHTQQWKLLKDTIIDTYLAKYPDITHKDLSVQLWLMGIDDQRFRTLSINNKKGYLNLSRPSDSIIKQKERERKDREQFVMDLINNKTFPTFAMVGKEASEAAVLIIQHSAQNKLFKKTLPLIETAAKQQQVNSSHYAIMIDRYLTRKGKKQIYGTSYSRRRDPIYDVYSDFFLHPIEDEKNVNVRRQELGMKTIEEAAAGMGISYQYNPENDKLSFKKIIKRNYEKAQRQLEERGKKEE